MFEILTITDGCNMSAVVMFQFEFFWVVTPCSVVGGYQRFRDPYCLHIHPEEVFRHHGPLKLWYPPTLHGVTAQKTST
jgi:hypothetical protein